MNQPHFCRALVLASLLATASVSANAAACLVSDVTFSSTYPSGEQAADACSNALDGTGNTPNLASLASLWGTGFVNGVTIGSAGAGSATGGTVLGGLKFTLSDIDDVKSGVYSLSIEDTNGATAPNLPYYLDFVLYLKGGSLDTSAYLFDDTLVDATGGGKWKVTFLNNGGKVPELSNISLWVREGTAPPVQIPEPGTIALLGLGLLGLGIARRRT